MLWTSLVTTIGLYVTLLVWGCVNVYRYLFKQDRFGKNGILSAFYALSILMCAVRITNYGYLAYCAGKTGQQDIGIVLLVDVIGDYLM